jgi:hypothetical protein
MNMLIKESQLIQKTDILNQLDEAVYLTQEEAGLNLSEVPVVVKENGINMVDYGYAAKLSEDNGYSLFESIELIKESNGIDNLILLVDEGDAIAMQEEFNPNYMVVRPISEDSYEVFWCDFVSEAYFNDEIDEDVFTEAIITDNEKDAAMVNKRLDKLNNRKNKEMKAMNDKYMSDTKDLKPLDKDYFKKIAAANNERKKRNNEINKKYEDDFDRIGIAMNRLRNIRQIHKNRRNKKIAAAVAGTALVGAGIYAYQQYKNKPKSVIGKRIAALRKVYTKFMNKAQSSRDSGVAAKLKKIAAKILQVIDKLLGYLQNKAG